MHHGVNGASKTQGVAIVYVRNVPEPLARLIRSQAALAGKSMSAYVLDALREKLAREGVELPDEDASD